MRAFEKDISKIAYLVVQLWPDNSLNEAEDILKEYFSGEETAVFIHEIREKYVGLALCGLRHDYVEGCETSPVGYLEGIVVDSEYRNQGIARTLCEECEAWAKEQGCTEFASDCELTNTESLRFHMRLGFQEENRIICFKKTI